MSLLLPFLAPFGAAIFGPIGILYFLMGMDENDMSGDGSLPFAIARIAFVGGAVGSVLVGTAATALGVSPWVSYPSAFYGTVFGVTLWVSRN